MSAFQENMKKDCNSQGKINTPIDANIMIMEEEGRGEAIKPAESRVKSDMLSIISKVLKIRSFVYLLSQSGKCF